MRGEMNGTTLIQKRNGLTLDVSISRPINVGSVGVSKTGSVLVDGKTDICLRPVSKLSRRIY